ncbi:MAG: hypothetical protein RRZ68_05390 [Oscillospiraceae bacterium]
MSEEKILRTSVFGGFKRTDVLTYVEELKNEIELLKGEIEKKSTDIDVLNSSVAALTEKYDDMKGFEQKFLDELEEKTKLFEENNVLNEQINELKVQNSEYEKSQADIDKTREVLKTTEVQLGAAFLDARKYSEEIVTAANTKVSEVSKAVSSDISQQAAEISRLSADVDKISLSFSKSIDELHSNILALAKKMSNAATSLEGRENAAFLPEVSITINQEKAEDELKFIKYPPNTDFNEDLNISSSSVYRFDKKKEG